MYLVLGLFLFWFYFSLCENERVCVLVCLHLRVYLFSTSVFWRMCVFLRWKEHFVVVMFLERELSSEWLNEHDWLCVCVWEKDMEREREKRAWARVKKLVKVVPLVSSLIPLTLKWLIMIGFLFSAASTAADASSLPSTSSLPPLFLLSQLVFPFSRNTYFYAMLLTCTEVMYLDTQRGREREWVGVQ